MVLLSRRNNSVIQLLLLVICSSCNDAYTADDDMSWAVRSSKLAYPMQQSLYDNFMAGCRKDAEERGKFDDCDHDEKYRIRMNTMQPRSVLNYTSTGFLKVKAPPEVFKLVSEFWETNKHEQSIEWTNANPYHNIWDSPPTVLKVDNETLPGAGHKLTSAIAHAARDAMEEWTGLPQSSTSVYGIRVYHNQSILAPHVDRFPLISSAIINVAQDVEEDWILEVFDHDGVAHNITMEPGDLVLYESHSVIHGRPFPMKGNFYANIFVHFEPLGPPVGLTHDFNDDMPPYLLPNMEWESEWRKIFPDGYKALRDTVALTQKGDLRTLRYIQTVNPSALFEDDGTPAQWKSIHEAVRTGWLEIVKFLIEEAGVDVNEPCFVTNSPTPLAIAYDAHGKDDPITKYLESKGGVVVLQQVEEEVDPEKVEL